MTGDEFARFLYLGLLVVAVGGFYLVEHRKNLGQTARYLAIWGLLFLGAIAAVGLWDDISGKVSPRQSASQSGEIEVPVSADGHFYLTLQLNDTPVRFVVDTGASDMVLTNRDAKRVGINTAELAFAGQANTANGVVATASVWISSVQLGVVRDYDLRASVNQGEMDTSLLGMSYLKLYNRMEITPNKLKLTR